jgi:hypothetical protein
MDRKGMLPQSAALAARSTKIDSLTSLSRLAAAPFNGRVKRRRLGA